MAQQTAQVTVGGTPENPVFNFVLPAGAKGEPGGWTQGVALTNENLNDITSPGLYKTSSPTNTTVANNYPPMIDWGGNSRTILEVAVWGGSSPAVVQRLTRIGHASGRAQVTYTRMRDGVTWSPWQTFVPQRVDNTAGRAIYTWDDGNSREQLIYGDTGWRTVPASELMNGFTGFVRIKRSLNTVALQFEMVGPAGAGATGLNQQFWALPDGFKLPNASWLYYSVPVVDTELHTQLQVRGTSNGLFLQRTPASAPATPKIQAFVSFETSQPWPAILPGI